MPDDDIFWALRKTPLHALTGEQWPPYYAQMAPYLCDARPDVREAAVERLMMAVFRSQTRHGTPQDRVRWLLIQIETANAVHSDILPRFLRGLRWHGNDHDFPVILLPWLDSLEAKQIGSVDHGLIRGARLLISPPLDDDKKQIEKWIALLDDPSNWVRGCAARKLATRIDDDNAKALVDLIASHEIVRPGVAGPFAGEFYSGLHCGPWSDGASMAAWMMDLLERKCGTDYSTRLAESCSFDSNAR